MSKHLKQSTRIMLKSLAFGLKEKKMEIIRIGLGFVFLANSYTAFTMPHEFVDLISESFLINILSQNTDTFVRFIGISDGLVAILLFIGAFQKYVAIYASVWILGVMSVIGVSELPHFLEHLGFLSMAIYLILNSHRKQDVK